MRKMRRTINRLEEYTYCVTFALVFAVSNIGFWCFTEKMIEDVVFLSLLTTVFAMGGIGFFIDKAFSQLRKNLLRGKKYA